MKVWKEVKSMDERPPNGREDGEAMQRKEVKNQVWLDAMDLVDHVDLVGVTSCCKYHGCSALLTNEEHGKSVFFQVLPWYIHAKSCQDLSRHIESNHAGTAQWVVATSVIAFTVHACPCCYCLLIQHILSSSPKEITSNNVFTSNGAFEENYPWNRSPWKSCLFELMYRTQWMWISFLESFDEGERLRCLLAPGSNQSLGAVTHLFSTISKRIPTHLAETAAKWNTNILTHWKNPSKLNLPAVSSLHEWSESNLDCIQVKAT